MSYTLPYASLTKAQQLDYDRTLFRKFCPAREGILATLFQERVIATMNSGYNDDICRAKICHKIVDPFGIARHLIESGELVAFSGNDTLENSRIVFLDDTCHPDINQGFIRGALFNLLKSQGKNVCLCEGFDATKFFFSKGEKEQYFAPNLDETDAKIYFSGWDDQYLHRESLKTMRLYMHKASTATATETEKAIDQVCFDAGHQRTQVMWRTIQSFRRQFHDAKIFVFAGAGHNHEEWLYNQLAISGESYCILTPRLSDGIENGLAGKVNDYYHFDQFGIWGNLQR